MIYFSAGTVFMLLVYMSTFLFIMCKNYATLNKHTAGLTPFLIISLIIFCSTLIYQIVDYQELNWLDAVKNFSLAILISLANKIHRKVLKK